MFHTFHTQHIRIHKCKKYGLCYIYKLSLFTYECVFILMKHESNSLSTVKALDGINFEWGEIFFVVRKYTIRTMCILYML